MIMLGYQRYPKSVPDKYNVLSTQFPYKYIKAFKYLAGTQNAKPRQFRVLFELNGKSS
jgi:hypothetical protein